MAKISVTKENIKTIVAAHDTYWDDRKPTLYKHKRAYETRMWESMKIGRAHV